MKKIILLLVLCIYITPPTQAQSQPSYELLNQDNQYKFGDLVIGHSNTFDLSRFVDNGTEREWLFIACNRGRFSDEVSIAKLYEKSNQSYTEVDIDLERVLFGGVAKFAQLNPDQDNIPDLIYSGSDGSTSYTDVYLSNIHGKLEFTQSLYGFVANAIAIMPNSRGDGFINTGINGSDDTTRTKIYKNDGSGVLSEVFSGLGGALSSAHYSDNDGDGIFTPSIHGTTNRSATIAKEHILQPDGTYKQVDSKLPT